MLKNKSHSPPLDEYDRNARLKPAFLVGLPASFFFASRGANYSAALAVLAGPLTAIGFTYFLAQIGRDSGRSKQSYLFGLWKGKPTTVKLRHRSVAFSPYTLARYHKAAGRLIGKKLPTPDEESAEPQAADLVYESVGDVLREKTRDKKKFPLIFKELVSYGFRRNLWGMKPVGLTITVICVALQIALIIRADFLRQMPSAVLIVLLGANLLLMGYWIFLVNPKWVKVPADAYAERLLAACEDLDATPRTEGETSDGN